MATPGAPKPNRLAHLDHAERLAQYDNPGDIARAMLALDASRMGSWSHHVPEDEIWGDRIVADLLGFDFDAQPWRSEDFYNMVHPADRDRVGKAVEEAYSGRVPFYDLELRRKPDENASDPEDVLWIGGRAQVTERDADGNPLRVIGVNWDVTETKQVEQRLAMLAGEMDHRVKNAFAVIRALINIGESMSQDKESFAATLRNQVEAMATAHTLSARMARAQTNAAARVALSDVIETALAPWIDLPADGHTQVRVTCPKDIDLPPAQVAAFAMMLYELSTNATKYGPLGENGGTLDVDLVQKDNGDLQFTWRETLRQGQANAGPNAENQGFGEVLLDHCANNLNASFRRDMTPSGMYVQLHMPMPQ